MFVAALISLGVPKKYLLDNLSPLKKYFDFKINIKKNLIQGINTLQFIIQTEKKIKHNPLSKIIKIIKSLKLDKQVENDAINIFKIIGEAESKIHNCLIEDVEFHEIGAVDSIIDILSAALCMNYLKVEKVYSTPLYFGKGKIEIAHGIVNIPVPAVLEITKGLPFIQTEKECELVTPTGAALVKYYVSEYKNPPLSKIINIGYSSGTRKYKDASYLQIQLLEELNEKNQYNQNEIYQIETNIDDETPEIIATYFEDILKLGAAEIYQIPIFMKKNRIGIKIIILTEEKFLQQIIDYLFENSTTSGIRYTKYTKVFLQRKEEEKKTQYGLVKVKKMFYKGNTKSKLEFEDCKKISKNKKIPLIKLYKELEKEIE